MVPTINFGQALQTVLVGTEDFGLYYKKNENFELRAYTDADWGGNIDDIKKISRGVLFLGRILVTWTSKKKSCTSQSTTKAKFVVATINYTNIVWIKHLLKGMKEEITKYVITPVPSTYQRIL